MNKLLIHLAKWPLATVTIMALATGVLTLMGVFDKHLTSALVIVAAMGMVFFAVFAGHVYTWRKIKQESMTIVETNAGFNEIMSFNHLNPMRVAADDLLSHNDLHWHE